jgi:hypothetical protein
MLRGRNHAASGTVGRLFFIFGGRGNALPNGSVTVQIYNPVTDTWVLRALTTQVGVSNF